MGVVQFANDTEVANKANVSKVVNPSQAFSMGLGVGQAWGNLTTTRSLNTKYVNNSNKPIFVSISCGDTGDRSPTVSIIVGGVEILSNRYDSGGNFGSFSHSFIVPPNADYRINCNVTIPYQWAELS